jgi:hypothetical protein
MNQQGSRGVSNGDAVAAGGAVSGHRYEDAQVDEMDVDMEMDEEDRLIAQGGIGIPLDAVRIAAHVFRCRGAEVTEQSGNLTEWKPCTTITANGP